MNFEKALEAMKQGKKVRRKVYSAYEYWFYNSDFDRVVVYDGENYRDFGVKPTHDIIESCKDDWEIYEEPKQEGPEMTAEKASKILDLILDYINVGEFEYITHCSFSEIAESVRLAIEALENQNQPKPEKKSKCGFNCKIQPAKFISDDVSTIAFEMFTAGLKFGLEIAKDLQKENKNNA